jgi:hypothetical protein
MFAISVHKHIVKDCFVLLRLCKSMQERGTFPLQLFKQFSKDELGPVVSSEYDPHFYLRKLPAVHEWMFTTHP